MKVPSLILLGASITAAAASDEVKLINRRDAIPIPDSFMNAVQAAPALRKRNLKEPIYYASAPGGIVKRSLLAPRQWGCETVGQINCSFEGCCNQGTLCGVYGGKTGCCPIGKTCSGVGGCKIGQSSCGSGCCPLNAVCTANLDGTPACDYHTGLSGLSSISTSFKSTMTSTRSLSSLTLSSLTLSSPTLSSPTASSPTSSSSSLGDCPNNYSPCSDSDSCCPAGVKCLPNKKCDAKCASTDVKCGSGCCKDGFICDTLTSICQDPSTGGGSSSDSGNSNSGTTPAPNPTATAGSGSGSKTGSVSSTTLRGVSSGLGGASGVASFGSRLVVGMGMAGIVAVVGVVLL